MIPLRGFLRAKGKSLPRRCQATRYKAVNRGETTRPRLESLEERLAPAFLISTSVTGLEINITPNLLSRTAMETVTATVTENGFNRPPPGGNIFFNLNNLLASVPIDSNGQATFTFALPLSAVGNNQTLVALYDGGNFGAVTYSGSEFFSPVYLNMWNAFLPAQITFGSPPKPQYPYGFFNSAGGEKDAVSVLFLPVDFNYVDPGRIATLSIGGIALPGYFAYALGVEQFG